MRQTWFSYKLRMFLCWTINALIVPHSLEFLCDSTTSSCRFQLCNIRKIQSILTTSSVQTNKQALVISRLARLGSVMTQQKSVCPIVRKSNSVQMKFKWWPQISVVRSHTGVRTRSTVVFLNSKSLDSAIRTHVFYADDTQLYFSLAFLDLSSIQKTSTIPLRSLAA